MACFWEIVVQPWYCGPSFWDPSMEENLKRWEELYPGFYKNVEKIPTSKFRVLYTGEPITQK